MWQPSLVKRFAAEVALRRCLSMPELCLYGVHPLIGGAADADESFGEPREALSISHARDRHGNRYMNQFLVPQFDRRGSSVAPRNYSRLYAAAYAGISTDSS